MSHFYRVLQDQLYYLYTYIKNRVRSDRKMMSFNQNELGQRNIINRITILTKRGTDMMHDVITTKYQKYTSIKILKNANVMAALNKSS